MVSPVANVALAWGGGRLEPVKTLAVLMQILQRAIFAQKQSIEVFSNILPDMVSRCGEPSSLLIEVSTNELSEMHLDPPEEKRKFDAIT